MRESGAASNNLDNKPEQKMTMNLNKYLASDNVQRVS